MNNQNFGNFDHNVLAYIFEYPQATIAEVGHFGANIIAALPTMHMFKFRRMPSGKYRMPCFFMYPGRQYKELVRCMNEMHSLWGQVQEPCFYRTNGDGRIRALAGLKVVQRRYRDILKSRRENRLKCMNVFCVYDRSGPLKDDYWNRELLSYL